ncbi:MAG: addiction module protein [Rickettsiales bacterium]
MVNFDFSRLSIAERIELAQNLMGSVRDEISTIPISEELKTEIELRVSELSNKEVELVSFADAKKNIVSGL